MNTETGAALPLIGGIATMPSRAHTFPRVLDAILPQVDRLYVYLDRFAVVPDIVAREPKIVPLLPAEVGNLGGTGKFLGAALFAEPCLYVCFDDDIAYPANYVAVMRRALERHYFRALIGLHYAFFEPPYLSYRANRQVFHFAGGLIADLCVDMLGTGTAAFYTGSLPVDPRTWGQHNVDDLLLSIEAVKRELPRIAIRRPPGFLRALEEDQPDSIYQQITADDTRQTEIMRKALETYPHAWHRWGYEVI